MLTPCARPRGDARRNAQRSASGHAESSDRQRDPCWHVSAKPHVFPRFAARIACSCC